MFKSQVSQYSAMREIDLGPTEFSMAASQSAFFLAAQVAHRPSHHFLAQQRLGSSTLPTHSSTNRTHSHLGLSQRSAFDARDPEESKRNQSFVLELDQCRAPLGSQIALPAGHFFKPGLQPPEDGSALMSFSELLGDAVSAKANVEWGNFMADADSARISMDGSRALLDDRDRPYMSGIEEAGLVARFHERALPLSNRLPPEFGSSNASSSNLLETFLSTTSASDCGNSWDGNTTRVNLHLSQILPATGLISHSCRDGKTTLISEEDGGSSPLTSMDDSSWSAAHEHAPRSWSFHLPLSATGDSTVAPGPAKASDMSDRSQLATSAFVEDPTSIDLSYAEGDSLETAVELEELALFLREGSQWIDPSKYLHGSPFDMDTGPDSVRLASFLRKICVQSPVDDMLSMLPHTDQEAWFPASVSADPSARSVRLADVTQEISIPPRSNLSAAEQMVRHRSGSIDGSSLHVDSHLVGVRDAGRQGDAVTGIRRDRSTSGVVRHMSAECSKIPREPPPMVSQSALAAPSGSPARDSSVFQCRYGSQAPTLPVGRQHSTPAGASESVTEPVILREGNNMLEGLSVLDSVSRSGRKVFAKSKKLYYQNKEFYEIRNNLRDLAKLQNDIGAKEKLLKCGKLFYNQLTSNGQPGDWVYRSVRPFSPKKKFDNNSLTNRKVTVVRDVTHAEMSRYSDCPARPFQYFGPDTNTQISEKLIQILGKSHEPPLHGPVAPTLP